MPDILATVRATADRVQLQLELRSAKILMLQCDTFVTNYEELLSASLEDTGFKCRVPVHTTRGEWTFDFSDVASNKWNNMLPLLRANLRRLQDAGRIEYAEWTPRIK